MSQILIPLNNTVWGVVPHIQRSDAYRHVLSFASEEIKDYYISYKLFNKHDVKDKTFWKTAIEDPHFKKSLIMSSATNASTIIDLDQINKNTQGLVYTQDDILNMDFLIVKENNQYKFYTVEASNKTGTPNQKTYSVQLGLDIFFTYDIKSIINDLPVQIQTAHYDRFIKHNDKFLPNLDLSSPNVTGEPFDSAISSSSFYPIKSYSPKFDFTPFIDPTLSADDKLKLNELLNNIETLILYSTKPIHDNPNNTGNDKSKVFKLNDMETSYYVYEFWDVKDFKYLDTSGTEQFVRGHTYKFEKYFGSEAGFPIAGWDDFHKKWQDQAGVVHASTLTATPAIFNMLYNTPENEKFTFTLKESQKIISIKNPPNYKGGKSLNNSGLFLISTDYHHELTPPETPFVESLNVQEMKTFGEHYIWKNDTEKTSSYAIQAPWTIWNGNDEIDKFVPALNTPLNLNWETKAITSSYSKMIVHSMSANDFEFRREFFDLNDKLVKIRKFYTYQTDMWREIFGIDGNYNKLQDDKKYDFVKTIYGYDAAENKLFYDNKNNYTLPTDTNAWNEYLIRNKSQLNNQILRSKIGIGAASAGTAAAAATGHIGAAGAGIFGIAKSILDLNQTMSMIKDIKRTPNTLDTTGGSLNGDMEMSNFDTKIIYESLDPIVLKQLQTHFMKYGVSYNQTLHNFNDVINTRYYFNHIQAPAIFENIERRLAPEIKILVNDTIAEGVTVWHIRTLDQVPTAKIKNYQIDNVELQPDWLVKKPSIEKGIMTRNSTNDLHLELKLKDENKALGIKTSIVDLALVSSVTASAYAPGITFPYVTEAMNPWDRVVNTSASGDVKLTKPGNYNDFKLHLKWKIEGSAEVHQDDYDLQGFEIAWNVSKPTLRGESNNYMVYDNNNTYFTLTAHNLALKDNNIQFGHKTSIIDVSLIRSQKIKIMYPNSDIEIPSNQTIKDHIWNKDDGFTIYGSHIDGRLPVGTYDDFKLVLKWKVAGFEEIHTDTYDIPGFVV